MPVEIKSNDVVISIVMPCLNEELTLPVCIKKAFAGIQKTGAKGEVVIADNGSTDNSITIAQQMGARVVHQPLKGYGNALIKGISEARGSYIIIGDSDDSYDFSSIEGFVKKLDEGNDVVMGTRLKGAIAKGAMSWSHRLGNPVMTWILNALYHTGISDANCGLRAFTKDAFKKMELKCGGMEFASEFVVKASKEKLKITEIPITLHKDGRNRPPHLRTFRDAWRHLRFLIIYSPIHLFLLPGTIMIAAGFFVLTSGLFIPFRLGHLVIDYHVNFMASILAIVGFELCMLGFFARSFAYIKGFDKHDAFIIRYIKNFSLERNLILGLLLMGLGLVFVLTIVVKWILSGFGPLFEVRKGIVAITLITIGFQYISASFFLSLLYMETPGEYK